VVELPKVEKRLFLKSVTEFLGTAAVKKSDEMTTSGILLLGYSAELSTKTTLLKYLNPRHSFYVRKNALLSLARLPLNPTGQEALIKAVFPYLADADFANVARHAMTILENMKLSKPYTKQLIKMLPETRNPALKQFAIKRIGQSSDSESVKLVLQYLDASDLNVREAAVAALVGQRSAVPELLKKLDMAGSPEAAEKNSGILKHYRDYFKSEKCKALYLKLDEALAKDGKQQCAYTTLLKYVNPDSFTRSPCVRLGPRSEPRNGIWRKGTSILWHRGLFTPKRYAMSCRL